MVFFSIKTLCFCSTFQFTTDQKRAEEFTKREMDEGRMQQEFQQMKATVSDMRCMLHSGELIRLFCTECQDAVCVQCLLEKHQQHPVQAISDVSCLIREKVDKWFSESESTLQELGNTKQQLIGMVEESKQVEIKLESDLLKCEVMWKAKLEEEIERLSSTLQDAFHKNRKRLQASIEKVSACEIGIESFCIESKSEAKVLRLYCSLKECMSGEFLNVNNIVHPSLQLDENIELSVGSVEAHDMPCDTHVEDDTSHVTRDCQMATGLEYDVLYPKRIPVTDLKYNVTKIIPTSDDEAWIISGRKLYNLNISGIKESQYSNDIDDIALSENGDLFILSRDSTFIFQMNRKGVTTRFTCTDPYTPLCMDYEQNNSTLLVWMNQKDARHMTLFGMNGIKKSSFGLMGSKSGNCYMSAMSCSSFAIVYDVEQITGLRNCIYSYKIRPTSYKSFAGMFGCSPYLQFVCKGICYDEEGCILVSDCQFNTVYKLDQNIQFQKMLLDKTAGLECPTVLAFRNGLLWVADAKFIAIYKYKDIL